MLKDYFIMQSLDLKIKEHTMNFIFNSTHLAFNNRYQKKNPQVEKKLFLEELKTLKPLKYIHKYFAMNLDNQSSPVCLYILKIII